MKKRTRRRPARHFHPLGIVLLAALANHLSAMEPASLKICALLDKPARREAEIEADYVGFTIPNEFVVGYGLDYNEKYRNLPFIGVLKPEVYGA